LATPFPQPQAPRGRAFGGDEFSLIETTMRKDVSDVDLDEDVDDDLDEEQEVEESRPWEAANFRYSVRYGLGICLAVFLAGWPWWASLVAGFVHFATAAGFGHYQYRARCRNNGGRPLNDKDEAEFLDTLRLLYWVVVIIMAVPFLLILILPAPENGGLADTAVALHLAPKAGGAGLTAFGIGYFVWLCATVALFPKAALDPHKRGRRLLSFEQAEAIADEIRPEDDPGLPWGGLLLSSAMAVLHWCICGGTGSGKTLTLRLLMQTALPLITKGSDRRALVYDGKKELLSLLHGMGNRSRRAQ